MNFIFSLVGLFVISGIISDGVANNVTELDQIVALENEMLPMSLDFDAKPSKRQNKKRKRQRNKENKENIAKNLKNNGENCQTITLDYDGAVSANHPPEFESKHIVFFRFAGILWKFGGWHTTAKDASGFRFGLIEFMVAQCSISYT